MAQNIYMDKSTYEYLKNNLDMIKSKEMVYYNGRDFQVGANRIVITNSPLVKPTIKEWLFPRDKFITYEKKDESWWRYFGLGKEGSRSIVGDIVGMETRENKGFYVPEIRW
jgi:hypothetical protein